METGDIGANDIDVVQYLAYCGCWLGEVQDVIDLCRVAEHQHGYWMSAFGQYHEDSIHSLVFHETAASTSISYEPHLVPGLLQTENYARALFPLYNITDHVEFVVHARMERQKIMYRSKPARFDFYLHEHVLRHVVGDSAIMQEQLLALMLLEGQPNVTIRVVPESSIFGGAFRLFQFKKHRSLVYLDTYVGGMFLEDREYVSGYNDLVPTIADIAMTEGQSREYFASLANEYDRRSARDHVEEKQL